MELKDSMLDCVNDESGTIYADWEHGDYRCIIMRGPCAMCGYIGVKSDHPAFGKDYSDIDISCHGGLTFAHDDKTGGKWPEGWWWFGWDYGHYGDVAFYDLKDHRFSGYESRTWSPKDVYGEFPEVINEFERLASFII